MSAAAAAGGGPPPLLSNLEVIHEVQDLLVNSEDSDESRLRERINKVRNILLADPDRKCQAKGLALQSLQSLRFDNIMSFQIREICMGIEELKMSRNLKNLFQELQKVETDKNLRTEDQKKARIEELIREIKKEYQGDILLLPIKINAGSFLEKELLKQCSKFTARKRVEDIFWDPLRLTSQSEKMEILKICIQRGADLKEIPEGYEAPFIIDLIGRAIHSLSFKGNSDLIDFPLLEEIFASGIVVPPLGVQLLELSFRTITSNSTLETHFPGLRNALVDYGADVDAFLTQEIGEEELKRLKAVVASNNPDKINQENRPKYPDYIALLQRKGKRNIYEKALKILGPEVQEGIAPAYAGEAAGFPQDLSDIISSFAASPRKVGLKCQDLRALERGGQKSGKKDEAAQSRGGGGGGGGGDGSSKSKNGAAAT